MRETGPPQHLLAGFNARCPWCGDPIEEGDAIVCVDESEWIHRDCAEQEGIEII